VERLDIDQRDDVEGPTAPDQEQQFSFWLFGS
jgi:hypothetical protein